MVPPINETPEERRERLDKKNAVRRDRESQETLEQRRDRLDRKNRNRKERDEREDAEERRERLNNQNLRRRAAISEETPEQKRARLDKTAELRVLNKMSLLSSQNQPNEHYCGKLEFSCNKCNALHFEAETASKQNKQEKANKTGLYYDCCQGGKVKLPALPEYPAALKQLLEGDSPYSKQFMENIRTINSSFGFASMGATIAPPPGYGPYCFRIHGQIYHRTGVHLHPAEGTLPQYAQLYILDTAQANDARQEYIRGVDINEPLLSQIADVMSTNPLARAYRMLYEVELDQIRESQAYGLEPKEVSMILLQNRSRDMRRFNLPTANEVAVVFRNEDGTPPLERDMLVHLRPQGDGGYSLQRMNILDKNVDPMVYPLLFPNGEQGWGVDIPRNSEGKRCRVTQKEYYSYRLAIRNGFNPIISAGKLTQQYLVDSYVKLEANRLNYIEKEQEKIRGDSLKGLEDWLASEAANQGKRPGKAIMLPSSFQGSPRNMQQRFQDAMAIVTKFGKPDIFVTVTCNPKWKEITENLGKNQTVENRPDLVARVFNMKLKSLLHDIVNKDGGIFGKVAAFVYTIEFQKRGLPHAHILLILDKESKLKTDGDVDNVVKAELPDRDSNPKLFEIMTSHMIHGPCGEFNKKSPCMSNGKCAKDFPKNCQETTSSNVDGYAKYRRRKIEGVLVKGKLIDNQWVVPYNPYLLLKYNCHINTEVCMSVKSVKYLFKYVYKGYDCADVKLKDSNVINHNEIEQYVEARYVCAPEASWRINGYPMHDRSHSIERLAVHLPGEQYVVVSAQESTTENVQSRISKARSKYTTLTGWFELNKIDEDARKYKYNEIPLHYTWHKDKTIWKERKGCFNVIGRMYTVSPKEGERYYLRLLLLHTTGATSFDDLKTVNGKAYSTFGASAHARGLLLDDNVWFDTLDEAKEFKMARQLRDLFAYICIFGAPTHPNKLWDKFKEHMIDDLCSKIHKKIGVCQNCEFYALKEIQDVLMLHGKSVGDYMKEVIIPRNLPPLNMITYDRNLEESKANELIATLNEDQRVAFDKIVEAVDDKDAGPKCFFLDGPGGSGKTYLYKTLLHYFRGLNKSVLPCASTGIAANLLEGGRTYHSLFKLGLDLNETSISSIKQGTNAASLIIEAALIVLDECTMVPSLALNCIERLMHELMGMEKENQKIPLGGKVFLLGGDFRQCLAIVPHAMRAAILQASLKHAKSWHEFETLTLRNNMRSVDPEYSKWLLEMGDGTLTNNYDLGDDIIEIPEKYICDGCLVTEIFGTSLSMNDIKNMTFRAILAPKNDDVDMLNDHVISLIEGELKTYFSEDTIDAEDSGGDEFFSIEFINSVTPSGMPPHQLKLKKGTIIMLLRNLNTKRGLCNGTRLIVQKLRSNVIQAEVITGSATGEVVFIPRIDTSPANGELPFKMKRRQFPVKAAFAMTINKSQGQTLDKVGIFLPQPVFGHGQLYVAFSRVRRAEDVKVKIFTTPDQGRLIPDRPEVFTKNVVYKEIFQSV